MLEKNPKHSPNGGLMLIDLLVESEKAQTKQIQVSIFSLARFLHPYHFKPTATATATDW